VSVRQCQTAAKVTIQIAARPYHEENEAGWKSTVSDRQWLASLENCVVPKLGDLAAGAITAADIITVLAARLTAPFPPADLKNEESLIFTCTVSHSDYFSARFLGQPELSFWTPNRS
jgi:hypothetical protein